MRDPNYASFVPKDDPRETRQADPDPYRGENITQLESDSNAGNAGAAYRLGLVNLYGLGGSPRNPQEAARYFSTAAGEGHAWAAFRLSQLYASGVGVGRDPRRAMELTFAAAKGGQAQAAYNIGMGYLDGHGFPQDSVEAVHWLTIAADNGVPEAQYNLGLLYYRGDGVHQQLFDALEWMRRGAQGGYLPAQKAVGRLYMTGLDAMGQDIPEAKKFLTIAAGKGDHDSQEWLAQIEKAEKEEQEYQRKLSLLAAQTAVYLAGAVMAAALNPPTEYVVYDYY